MGPRGPFYWIRLVGLEEHGGPKKGMEGRVWIWKEEWRLRKERYGRWRLRNEVISLPLLLHRPHMNCSAFHKPSSQTPQKSFNISLYGGLEQSSEQIDKPATNGDSPTVSPVGHLRPWRPQRAGGAPWSGDGAPPSPRLKGSAILKAWKKGGICKASLDGRCARWKTYRREVEEGEACLVA
nr:hypothetical protein Iba_chr10eCG10070 [Ipomoea batatas]